MSDGRRAAGGAEVRKRVLWTLLGVVLFRLGQDVPMPYVDVRALAAAAEASRGGQLHWLIDVGTGGGVFRLSYFAFGVLPVLVGGLVLRLLIDTVPRLGSVRAAGATGVRGLRGPHRWLTGGAALVFGVVLVALTALRRFPGSVAPEGEVLVGQGFLPFAVLASLLLFVPVLAGELLPGASWLRGIRAVLADEGNPWRLTVYFGLIWFGTAFAVTGRYHPDELAARIARQGGFVPGIRPGRTTAVLLGWITNRIAFAGGFAVAVLSVLPPIGLALLGAAPRLPFGGVTVLLLGYFTVHLALATVRRLDVRRRIAGYRPHPR